ncbi:aldo/keto reductase slr0942-like isoform X2 [Oculina patagonica]
MPSIGLGTWKSNKGEVGKAVRLALQYGYRHIDCAQAYGNEDEIGEALAEVFKEGKLKREDVFITSKLWCNCHAPEDVLPACQETLRNLQLDYLDLYLINLPCAFKKDVLFPRCIAGGVIGYSPKGIAKTWKAMEKLVDKGLCKAIGISNFTAKKTKTLLKTAKIVPACNQVELHPYLPQEKLIAYCKSKGIAVTAYSPLGSPDRPAIMFPDKLLEPVVLGNPVLKTVAEKHGTSTALINLAWGIKRGTPVLPKAVSENHIKENLEALHVNLDEDDMKAIENIGIHHRYVTYTWMYKPEEIPKDFWDGEE